MTHSTSFTERVQQVFQPTPDGVVGLVDNLLVVCRDHHLALDFQENHCHIRPVGPAAQDGIDVPVQKSVFRAALARIATLCNERRPNSVTPYRGAGELTVGTNPPASFHVAFTNTTAEQRLEILHLPDADGDASKFTVLLRDNRIVTVYGHALKYLRSDTNPTDDGSYGILSRVGGTEVLVALFRVSEVTGVFHGDLHGPAASA